MNTPAEARQPVLEVEDLVTRFHTDEGTVYAVDGISYSLYPGESLAIVGESGSGKTVGALSLLDLVPAPNGRIEGGRIVLDGKELTALPKSEWSRVRGKEISMVFQDPMTSLNPVMSVGNQMAEVLKLHLAMTKDAARARSVELLEMVGIPGAEARLRDYPHQFSGGQRQRIMIAMALATDPKVLLADEPTTALDVTIQAQIVDLVQGLQKQLGMAVVWITHDLALVAGLADRVLVMYAGRIVEAAPVSRLFSNPGHPYTALLLRSLPRIDDDGSRLTPIAGRPPDLSVRAPGCAFAPRCPLASDRCVAEAPILEAVGDGHQAACWRSTEVGEMIDDEPPDAAGGAS
ncbi:MAG: ABC transporter ATP-binding protein [Longimicrobiales bacterium]